MINWDWHDFELQKQDDVSDEAFDPYATSYETEVGEYVSRDFVLEIGEDRKKYTVGFQRITSIGVMSVFVSGLEKKISDYKLPDSGAWVVSFDRTDESYTDSGKFLHVKLGTVEKMRVVSEVACAIRDHYNSSKPGLYCWVASREELVEIYDAVLGDTSSRKSRVKTVPNGRFFNELSESRRGYAIITQYY